MLNFITSILIWTIVYMLTSFVLKSTSLQDFLEKFRNLTLNQVLIYTFGGIVFNSVNLLLGATTIALIVGVIVSAIVILVLEK